MSGSKIRLEQIEDGRTLKQLVRWFKVSHESLRTRSRRAAERAGLGPQDIARLIADVRSRRAKTSLS